MMRVWIVLAALSSFAGSAAAENVLMKSNGLGLAAVGMIGATAAGAALSDPPQWQGYPKGGSGLPFSDDAPAGAPADCAPAGLDQLAKALKNQPAETPKAAASEGRIKMSDSIPPGGNSQIFDSKAIYSGGQTVSCAPH